MTELLHHASDDQMALAICFGAVACCGLIMYFSHHVGRLTGHIRMHETGVEIGLPHALRHAPQSIAAATARHEKAA